MGYLHIENLYRPVAQVILLFREVYALEKVHGTSAHIHWHNSTVTYSSGGESHERFRQLFDEAALTQAFHDLGHNEVVVYGEAYGGKCQSMRKTYGDALAFIAFDVRVGGNDGVWLNVPNAHDVATKLGLEFVPYHKVSTDLAALDAERDRPSEVAVRRGCGDDKVREGVVLRPLQEFTTNNGNRVIVKHKGAAFSETKSPRPVDPTKRVVFEAAQAIADEYVTDERLRHVLDKIEVGGVTVGVEATPRVIAAMVEDVLREGSGEVVDSRDARAAIGRRTAEMFKALLRQRLGEGQSSS